MRRFGAAANRESFMHAIRLLSFSIGAPWLRGVAAWFLRQQPMPGADLRKQAAQRALHHAGHDLAQRTIERAGRRIRAQWRARGGAGAGRARPEQVPPALFPSGLGLQNARRALGACCTSSMPAAPIRPRCTARGWASSFWTTPGGTEAVWAVRAPALQAPLLTPADQPAAQRAPERAGLQPGELPLEHALPAVQPVGAGNLGHGL